MQIELVEEKIKRIESKYKKQVQQDWYDMDESQVKDKIEGLDKPYQAYRNLWRKIKSHIKQDEYKNFNFKPESLQGKLRELNPYRGGECQVDGYYQLIQNENFDQIMSNLLNDGTEAIQRLWK